MIVRIVGLRFKEGGKDKFLALLDEHVETVRNQPGCQYLEILADVHENERVVTYSYWDSESDLNNYRRSDFFNKFWPQVKAILEYPAQASSFEVNRKLP